MYIDLKDTKQKIVNRAGELKKIFWTQNLVIYWNWTKITILVTSENRQFKNLMA